MTARRWRSAAIMTFGGPKGTITLSLALTIPYMTDDGSAFPMRSELIFVAAGVIIVTLVLANFALPLLAPSQGSEVPAQQVEKSIKVLRGTVRELSSRITDENRLAIQQVIKQYNHRIAKLKSRIGQYSPKDFQDLQVQTMEWEQDYMEERLSRIEEAQDQLEERLRSEDAGIEQTPASTQSATGNQTEAEPSTEAETVADMDADAQLIDRRSERGDDQEELLNLRSQEQAAHRILSTISGSLFHLDRGGELRWRAYTARRRLRGLLHSQFHRLKHLTQPIDKDQVFVAGRHLQAEMNHFLIEKLYSELGKGRFKTEDLLNTIINHQMIESSAEGKTEYAGIPAIRDQLEETKREGYAIELSQIQDMVESGEISRTTARKMRRNVYVMQVDADSAL